MPCFDGLENKNNDRGRERRWAGGSGRERGVEWEGEGGVGEKKQEFGNDDETRIKNETFVEHLGWVEPILSSQVKKSFSIPDLLYQVI